jgi:hypothetical protein
VTRWLLADRRWAAAVVALGVFAFGVQSALSAGSASKADSIVVSGTIVDANKQALPSLQVVLMLAPLTNATTFKSLLVGSTTTDAAGHFSIAAEVTPYFQKIASVNDGWLNFDLSAAGQGLAIYRSVPRQLVKGGWIGPPEDGGSVDVATLDLAPGQPGVGPIRRRSLKAAGGARRILSCSETTTLLATATLVTTVGELHAVRGNARFNYGPTADSNIDAVVSVGSAPWSAAGTVHIGNSRTAPGSLIVAPPFHRRLRTYFVYKKWRTVNTCTGSRVTIKAWRWAASKLVVGKTTDLSVACTVPPFSDASHKQSFGASSSFLRNSSLAKRWVPAVNLLSLGGPTSLAGSRSGYSLKVWGRWWFTTAGSLCGDTALPPTSLRIFAGG